MYSRSANGGEKGDPNGNPWYCICTDGSFNLCQHLKHNGFEKVRKIVGIG
jgi:hypothetical protein